MEARRQFWSSVPKTWRRQVSCCETDDTYSVLDGQSGNPRASPVFDTETDEMQISISKAHRTCGSLGRAHVCPILPRETLLRETFLVCLSCGAGSLLDTDAACMHALQAKDSSLLISCSFLCSFVTRGACRDYKVLHSNGP